MRIAYIVADRGVVVGAPNGSGVHVAELVGALAARGARPTIFAASGSASGDCPSPVVDLSRDPVLNEFRARTAKRLRETGGNPLRAGEAYALLLNQVLAEALASHRAQFDVIYERHSLWSLAGLQYARSNGIPYLLEVNAPLTVQQREYRDLEFVEAAESVEQLVFSQADRVLVTTPALVDYAHERGATRRAIRILPCGASPETTYADRARQPSAQRCRDGYVVGFLGSLKPWHGLDILLRAFRRLHESSSDYRLLIVGDGPMRAEVEEYCRRKGLSGAVTLTGAVDHARIPDLLAQMDVGVAPYPALDPFYFSPLKVWEYAAARVPIAASMSGEIPRQFPHKEAALLHPPGSVSRLAEHIELLRRSPDLAPRLVRKARRVAQLHSWDRLAGRVLRIAANARRRQGGRRAVAG